MDRPSISGALVNAYAPTLLDHGEGLENALLRIWVSGEKTQLDNCDGVYYRS